MSKDDHKTNGSTHAFPHLHLMPSGNIKLEGGLSKREYFAALIMQGFCTKDPNDGRMACDKKPIAEWAVKRADALLAALAANGSDSK